MDQFLQQTERTKPSADCPAKQHPEGKEQPRHVEAEGKLSGTVHSLQSADGTGKARRRAGVAVESRIAELFPFSRIDFSALKVQKMRVGTAKGDELEQFSFDCIGDFHMLSHFCSIYPSPIHSRQMLTALFRTTPASPRIKPYMMKEKAVRSPAILSFVFILPSMSQLHPCYCPFR